MGKTIERTTKGSYSWLLLPSFDTARSSFYRSLGFFFFINVCMKSCKIAYQLQGAPPSKPTSLLFWVVVHSSGKPLHARSGASVSKSPPPPPASTNPKRGGRRVVFLVKSCCVCVCGSCGQNHAHIVCLNRAPRRCVLLLLLLLLLLRALSSKQSSLVASSLSLSHSRSASTSDGDANAARSNPTTQPAGPPLSLFCPIILKTSLLHPPKFTTYLSPPIHNNRQTP